MKNSVALIGGTGFIGTNLALFFNNLGFKVLVLGRSDHHREVYTAHGIEYRLIDVNYTSKLVDLLHEYENIVWLVNDLVPSVSMDSLVDDYTFNVKPLVDFLELTPKLRKMKRFLFVSSGGTIYGESVDHADFHEGSNLNPISAYGLSKIISENYIGYLTRKSHFQSIILRPSNIFGPFQNLKKPQGIVGFAFNSILKGTSLDLYNEGMVIRDFIYVDDFAKAVNSCLNDTFVRSQTEIYNVGSQCGVTIKSVVESIHEVTGIEVKTIAKPARSFDTNYNVLDISKITANLNWKPTTSLDQGLANVWNWLKAIPKQ